LSTVWIWGQITNLTFLRLIT